jgi:phosphoribosylamine-glycine ligase
MGAYAPAPCLTPGLSKVCAAVCQQTVEAMAKEVHYVRTLNVHLYVTHQPAVRTLKKWLFTVAFVAAFSRTCLS